jgi:hypothetical protein
MENSPHIRAYLNPQPALSEAEQKALVAPFQPAAIYTESRNEPREAFIGSLRNGNAALVPELFVLAKATGRKDGRFSDLMIAKDEIHDAGAFILEASTGHRSDNRAQWPKMRQRAKEMLGGAVKAGKVGRQPHGYTPDELSAMRAIKDSRHFKNWPERLDAIILRGIKPPGRTWFYDKLPSFTDQLARAIEPAKLPKKKPQRVYFIQSGDRVKIGISSEPKARLKSLETSNHAELKLLATIPGGRRKEIELHGRFADFHVKGEWFEFSTPIKKFIAGIKSAQKRKR